MNPEMAAIHVHQGVEGAFYAATTAVIVGEVAVGADANIWHYCSIRGDVAPIRIGRRVNVQDGSVLHCEYDVPMVIEDEVAIGHQAVVHCTHVGGGTLIGIGAVVLDGCRIGRDCLIAAGSVVVPGTEVPDGSVLMGTPGRVVRPIRDEERAYIRHVISSYVSLAQAHVGGHFPPTGTQRSIDGGAS